MVVQSITAIVYPVKDREKAKAVYGSFLGAEPYVDSPYYVGFRAGNLEAGLDPHGKGGPIAYTDVKDISMSLRALADAGAGIVQDIKEVGGGLLIAQVRDADGNILGLRQQS